MLAKGRLGSSSEPRAPRWLRSGRSLRPSAAIFVATTALGSVAIRAGFPVSGDSGKRATLGRQLHCRPFSPAVSRDVQAAGQLLFSRGLPPRTTSEPRMSEPNIRLPQGGRTDSDTDAVATAALRVPARPA